MCRGLSLVGQQNFEQKRLPHEKLTIVVLAVVLGSCCLHAQKSGNPSSEDPARKTQLLAQVDAFMDAWKKQDAAALTATLAPGFLYASPTGVASREGAVGALTHVCIFASYSLSDVRVLPISADAAALIYQIHQNVVCGGHAGSPVSLNTDT